MTIHEGDLIVTKKNRKYAAGLTEVRGTLDMVVSASMPNLVKVGGDLFIFNKFDAPLLTEVGARCVIQAKANLPSLAKVGGSLVLNPRAEVPKLTHAFGVAGTLIAREYYGLWMSNAGRFYAGRRVAMTKGAALEHWGCLGRPDDRACLFTLAIALCTQK